MSDVVDVDVGALANPEPPPGPASPPPLRSRRWARIVAGVMAVALVGGAVWWRHSVTADPKLEFLMFNRVNRVEHDSTGARDGIVYKENLLGTEVDMTFAPNQRVFVYLGLRNGGRHTVRIESVPVAGFYYFGFDRMEVSPDRKASIGEATTYQPFKPFSLRAGEGRNVRLNFRLADCLPTQLQEGTKSIGGLRVRYRILGIRRTVEAGFERSVLAVPVLGLCDHPFLDPSIAGS